MEWHLLALVLCLSLPPSTKADCSTHCLTCAQQSPDVDTLINSLTCTLECEGTLPSTVELDKCDNVLQLSSGGLKAFNQRNGITPAESETGELQGTSVGPMFKRYGGFLKKLDKNKIFTVVPRENAILKGLLATKDETSIRKLGERDTPELEQDTEQEGGASQDELGVYNDDSSIHEAKRYGGFLRKFGPKRSDNSADQSSREELQKRYGGFMRRIRPKLKWANQKRYGGFLRRHFKISVRSDEEPGSYDSNDL
ncbi:proenkephalin-B-like [Megalops cyprinoides]|uniref:proenkephalin-B-like n=1 Tax=Megalops cyprinoides TaxID=118141 RepID=UPI00186565B1|nr:proenkephalin-B-like [Megalops cyprinoides]